MANKATGKILTPDIPFGIKTGDTVTIVLKRGMRVIGKSRDCNWYGFIADDSVVCTINAKGKYLHELRSQSTFVPVRHCPCGLWKPKKGAK